MKQTYNMSFVTAPSDPRFDNAIGQPFVLSYFNSEEGVSYGFRFKPINESLVRIEQRFTMAEAKHDRTVREQRIEIRADRISKQNISVNRRYPYAESVHKYLEYMMSRNFYGEMKNLRDQALLYTLTCADKEDSNSIVERVKNADLIDKPDSIILDGLRIFEDITPTRSSASPYDPKLAESIKPTHILQGYVNAYREQLQNGILPEVRLTDMRYPNIGLIYERKNSSDKPIDTGIIVTYVNMIQPDKTNVYVHPILQTSNTYIEESNTIRFLPVSLAFEPQKYGHIKHIRLYDQEEKEGIHVSTYKKGIIDGEDAVTMKSIFVEQYAMEGYESRERLYASSYYSEARMQNTQFADSGERESLIDKGYQKSNGKIEKDSYYDVEVSVAGYDAAESFIVRGMARGVHLGKDIVGMNHLKHFIIDGKEAKSSDRYSNDIIYVDVKRATESYINWDKAFLDRISKDSRIETHHNITYADLLEIQSMTSMVSNQVMTFTDKMDKNARITKDATIKVESMLMSAMVYQELFVYNKIPKDAREEIHVQSYADLALMDAKVLQEVQRRADLVRMEAWVQHIGNLFTKRDKIGLLTEYWDVVEKVSKYSYTVGEELRQKISEMMEKIAKDSMNVTNVEQSLKEVRPAMLYEVLQSDLARMEAMFSEVMRIDRIIDKPNTFFKPDIDYASREANYAIAGEILKSVRDQSDNEAIVVKDFKLAGDNSDWELIWKLYSPGIDYLDPPDSDFDYSKLAGSVYNLKTGVPYQPLSPTNVPDVRVKTPLHHPMPEHFDLGVDDLKAIAVDNYVFIDLMLALESLKSRSKLRYAGMPAERAVRELFAKLFAWIQNDTLIANSSEYNRMFRFARWYAESAVISISEHILHREYDKWTTSLHKNGTFGTEYLQTGWKLFPSSEMVQTISTQSTLSFEKENYIDGQIIIRGYFDNPLSQGTMEISVDGSVVDTFSLNGPFTRTLDVPQGNHLYELSFTGDSGSVAISYIEITGCTFVSAHTTSDDSNTNGLKAITKLMTMLMSYFELHHSNHKVKGALEIKQRKVWNTQT